MFTRATKFTDRPLYEQMQLAVVVQAGECLQETTSKTAEISDDKFLPFSADSSRGKVEVKFNGILYYTQRT
jgi:hypothetical protein